MSNRPVPSCKFLRATVGLCGMFACAVLAAVALAQSLPPIQRDQIGFNQPSLVKKPESGPMDPKQLAEINRQRQAQLASDSAQLLALATELKAEVDKTTKDTLSVSVIKKATQVEKLAHKVREEMKVFLSN